MTSVVFSTRARLWMPIALPGSATARVIKYSRMAIGGSDKAEIEVTGGQDDIYALLDWLRCGVDIFNAAGTWVWNGYISSIEIDDPENGTVEADLDSMYNEVAITYTQQEWGDPWNGMNAQTDYAQDADSVATYGRRQLLETKNACNPTLAEAARTRKLSEVKYPTAVLRPEKRAARYAAAGKITARLQCYGWWHSLDWLYCNVPSTLVLQYETIGTGEGVLGMDNNDDALNVSQYAQQFLSGATGWSLVQAAAYVKKVGSPPETFEIDICADDDGEPGTSLGSGSIAAANIDTAYGWEVVTFSSAITIEAGKKYWFVPSTSGLNSDNYYMLKWDTNLGYPDGAAMHYHDSAWSTISGDIPFRLYADSIVDTAQQVRSIIAAHGQFFTAIHVDITNGSGLTSETFRDGSRDALEEIRDLMGMGTSNYRRMLADVLPGRVVRIYEEPASTAFPDSWRDGTFYQLGTGERDKSTCPVGIWATHTNALPSSASVARLGGLGSFFVERSEFDVESQSLTFEPLVGIDRYDLQKKE